MDDDKDFLLEYDEDFITETPSEEEQKEIDNVLPLNQIIGQENNTQEESVITPAATIEEPIVPDNSMKSNEQINIQPTLEDTNKGSKDIQYQPNNIKKFIYKNSRILPIIAFCFVSVLGVYIFVHNVNADIIDLIKIEEKQKYGYINDEGNVIVRPKYLYGSDFYKGFAIVKNYNNLYGVIDSEGDNEIGFGNIFSASLYDDRYIVSKFTKEGLKMGLLDSNLKEVTRIKYDNLSYSKAGIFMFTDNNTMGIMNKNGKELYSYKVDEIDDKEISVEVSNISDKSSPSQYAKIKVNSSSTIINISTGKEVYKYTLDDIRVLDNNVFYVKNENGNNKYFIIKDDKIVYQTDEYKRLRVEDIDSDIAIAIKEDASLDYINLLTKEKINNEGNIKYTYSDGIVLQEMYNFQTQKNEFTVITPKKILGTFSDIELTDNEFINGFAKINTENDKYNFVNKFGNVLSDKEYEEVSDFNKNGFAIVSNDNSHGVINTSGKEIIDLKYDDIKFLDDTLFKNISKRTSEQLFIFKENNKYGIINSDKKVVIKPVYDDFKTVTTKYPIIKAKYNNNYILINLETHKDLSIDSNSDVQVYENYIVSNSDYYNYDGQIIYTVGDNDEE